MAKLAACQLPQIIGDPSCALTAIRQNAELAERAGANLVCFPEAYLQGYDVSEDHVRRFAIDIQSNEFDRVLSQLENLTPALVIGFIEREQSSYFNSAAVIANGSVVCRYRKTHLLASECAIFEAGGAPAVFDLSGETFGINICADLNSPECVQATVSAGARIIVCPCNNMMSHSKAEQWKARHNEIRSTRAREASVWLLSSDVTGQSGSRISYGPTALIDPGGRVVEQVPLMATGMIVADTHVRSAA